jgi:hypothetical protein
MEREVRSGACRAEGDAWGGAGSCARQRSGLCSRALSRPWPPAMRPPATSKVRCCCAAAAGCISAHAVAVAGSRRDARSLARWALTQAVGGVVSSCHRGGVVVSHGAADGVCVPSARVPPLCPCHALLPPSFSCPLCPSHHAARRSGWRVPLTATTRRVEHPSAAGATPKFLRGDSQPWPAYHKLVESMIKGGRPLPEIWDAMHHWRRSVALHPRGHGTASCSKLWDRGSVRDRI